jgi:hypothetical protein
LSVFFFQQATFDFMLQQHMFVYINTYHDIYISYIYIYIYYTSGSSITVSSQHISSQSLNSRYLKQTYLFFPFSPRWEQPNILGFLMDAETHGFHKINDP